MRLTQCLLLSPLTYFYEEEAPAEGSCSLSNLPINPKETIPNLSKHTKSAVAMTTSSNDVTLPKSNRFSKDGVQDSHRIEAAPLNIQPVEPAKTSQTYQDAVELAQFDQILAEPEQARSRFRVFMIMAALFSVLFISALNTTTVGTAIPTICAQLHSASGYAWIGGAYVLANAAAAPIWSKLSDIWGRKLILLAAVALYFFSSIICALAVSMKMLLVGRAVQGTAAGGLMQLVFITISDLFSMRFLLLSHPRTQPVKTFANDY